MVKHFHGTLRTRLKFNRIRTESADMMLKNGNGCYFILPPEILYYRLNTGYHTLSSWERVITHASLHTIQKQAIIGDIVTNWPFPTRAVREMRVGICAHFSRLQIFILNNSEINAAYSRVSRVRSCQPSSISIRFSKSWSTCKTIYAIYSWGNVHTSSTCHVSEECSDNTTWQDKKAWRFPANQL